VCLVGCLQEFVKLRGLLGVPSWQLHVGGGVMFRCVHNRVHCHQQQQQQQHRTAQCFLGKGPSQRGSSSNRGGWRCCLCGVWRLLAACRLHLPVVSMLMGSYMSC
jgi:hypothetical protein